MCWRYSILFSKTIQSIEPLEAVYLWTNYSLGDLENNLE